MKGIGRTRAGRHTLRARVTTSRRVANALVAEYNSRRSEIGRFQDHQKMVTAKS